MSCAEIFKKTMILILLSLLIYACGSKQDASQQQESSMTLMEKQKLRMAQSYVGVSKNQKNASKMAIPIKTVQAIEKNNEKNNQLPQKQSSSHLAQKKLDALENITQESSTQTLDKIGFIKRLNDYPLCMITDKTQRELIPIRSQEIEKTEDKIYDLIEVECVFFAYQGSFEYWLFERNAGQLIPLLFDFAQNAEIQGNERKTPIAIREDLTHELCGIPTFDPKSKVLKSLCKGDPQGSCGAYAEFQLDLEEFNFKKIKGKQQLCSDGFGLNQQGNTDVEAWMNVQ